jgi:superfamily II DNA or RNA helicase
MEAWGGITPRAWQAAAFDAAIAAIGPDERPLIEAVMGAGKSVLIAELAAWGVAQGWRVVVSTPTVSLVEQLGGTVRRRVPDTGQYYTHAKGVGHAVTVTCYPSVGAMMAADARPVDLWICDEAHRTESARELAAVQVMAPARRIALTATPYLAGAGGLSLWTSLIYRYPLGQALADGVLCPWETVSWDGDRADVDEVMCGMIAATEGPGVVDARSIEDAETYAELLCAAGIPAAPIHSQQTPAVRRAALAALQAGRLRALVQVSMLVEGVDLPWLRWLGLRRQVGSRVRFLQQVGRVLRTHPGKTVATILDPWGLMERHDLEYQAALGGAYDAPEDAPETLTPADEDAWDLIDLPAFEEAPRMVPRATARRAVAVWARRLLHAAMEAGVAAPSEWTADASWRKRKASAKQVGALGRMVWALRFVRIQAAKNGVKLLAADGAEHLTAGAVSDLLDVLMASRSMSKTRPRGWSWAPVALVVPPLPARVTRALECAP